MKPVIKILIWILPIVFSNQCKRIEPPVINTLEITDVTPISAVINCEVISDGGKSVRQCGVVWNVVTDPGSHGYDILGSGTGSFTKTIYSFLPKTTYTVKTFAYNGEYTAWSDKKEFTTPDHNKGSFTDARDGNIYKWVEIGSQTWMAENLNFLADTGCWVYDNNNSNAEIYGRLYNWAAANSACPDGWHLPSDYEWKQLEISLGMNAGIVTILGIRGSDEGGKLKETGTTHWQAPNSGATNSSGFSALPAGVRNLTYDDLTVSYDYIGYLTGFWTSTPAYNNAFLRSLGADTKYVVRTVDFLYTGLSVRCVKD